MRSEESGLQNPGLGLFGGLGSRGAGFRIAVLGYGLSDPVLRLEVGNLAGLRSLLPQ